MIYTVMSFCGLPREKEILKLRLAEELPSVDKMIIVESDHTFSGKPKDRVLPDMPKLWKRPKVELLKFELDPVNLRDTWRNAEAQRNATMDFDYKPDDIIIWSDLDEINNAKDIPKILKATTKHGYVRIGLHNHCYYINNFGTHGHWRKLTSSFAVTGRYLRRSKMTFHTLRKEWCRAHMTRHPVPVVNTDGHHFDYLLTPKEIAEKLTWIAASCYNKPKFKDLKYLRKAVANGWDMLQRERGKQLWVTKPFNPAIYPKSVIDNMADWKPWIKEWRKET